MESLSWSQTVSSRALFSPPMNSSQFSVFESLDFAALLTSDERSLNLPSLGAGSIFSRRYSDYQREDSQPSMQPDNDSVDSLRQRSSSERSEQDQVTNEADDSDNGADNEAESASVAAQQNQPFNESYAIVTEIQLAGEKGLESKQILNTQVLNAASENSETQSNDVKNKHKKTSRHSPTDSTSKQANGGKLHVAESNIHPAASADPRTHMQQGPIDASLQNTSGVPTPVFTTDGENSLFDLGVALEETGLAPIRSGQFTPLAEISMKQLLKDRQPKEAVRDARGIGNRRSKAQRWFERSGTVQPGVDSQATAQIPRAKVPFENSSIQVGLAFGHGNPALSKQSIGTQSVTEPQTEQLLLSTVTALPSQISLDLPQPINPAWATPASEAQIPSGSQSSSELGSQTAQVSGSSEQTTARSGDSNLAIDRMQFGIRSGQGGGQEYWSRETWSQENKDTQYSTDKASESASINLARAERLRMIQRVARSFHRLGTAGGTVQLRLHPPELGSLAMQVQLEGRNMTARLTTESVSAKEIILDSLPQLRSRLADQGYQVMEITVDVADQGAANAHGDSSSSDNLGNGSGGDAPSAQFLATDLRRSASLRRQLDAQRLPTNPMQSQGLSPSQSIFGNRGIDLHA